MNILKLNRKLEAIKIKSENKRMKKQIQFIITYLENEYSKIKKELTKTPEGNTLVNFIESETQSAWGRISIIEGIGNHSKTLESLSYQFAHIVEDGILCGVKKAANKNGIPWDKFYVTMKKA